MDFCGDLANWSTSILSSDNAPLVHSVSYGIQGNLSALHCEDAKIQLVDDNFAKLAAKGITVLFSSGDSGSGYADDPQAVCKLAPSKDIALTGTTKPYYPD